jgi:ribosomal protein S18 acetylase RimI-like enzyme
LAPLGGSSGLVTTLRAVSADRSRSDVQVHEATEVSDALIEAFTRLIPQLSSSSLPPDRAALQAMVDAPSSILFVATRPDGDIVGSLTLAVFRIPTGVRAWIEDVVVDEAARGAGVGEALVLAAQVRAETEGARTVDLTSRPSRESANRLYQRLGFATRSTNVYRWSTTGS